MVAEGGVMERLFSHRLNGVLTYAAMIASISMLDT